MHEVDDCNNADKNNIIYIAKDKALNRPLTNDAYFIIWAYSFDVTSSAQFAMEVSGGSEFWFRKKMTGVWMNWMIIKPEVV